MDAERLAGIRSRLAWFRGREWSERLMDLIADTSDLIAEVERLQAPTFPNERNAVTLSPALMAENLRIIEAELVQPWRSDPDAD